MRLLIYKQPHQDVGLRGFHWHVIRKSASLEFIELCTVPHEGGRKATGTSISFPIERENLLIWNLDTWNLVLLLV